MQNLYISEVLYSQNNKNWNAPPRPITNKSNSLATFKTLLLDYYHSVLKRNYNVDDARTSKTICLKCKQARDLSIPVACSF